MIGSLPFIRLLIGISSRIHTEETFHIRPINLNQYYKKPTNQTNSKFQTHLDQPKKKEKSKQNNRPWRIINQSQRNNKVNKDNKKSYNPKPIQFKKKPLTQLKINPLI